MIGYLIRRILQTIIVLFFVTVFTLFLVHLFPGGPIKAMLGQRATPQQVNYYNHIYGFDQPFYVQYIKWIGQLLHGNLGFSNKLNMSVGALIAQDLPKTIILVLLGTFVSLAFGIPLGLYQAVKRYTVGDYVLPAGSRVVGALGTHKDVALHLEAVLGTEISAQRDVVRAWLARSEPSRHGMDGPARQEPTSVTRVEGRSGEGTPSSVSKVSAVSAVSGVTSVSSVT